MPSRALLRRARVGLALAGGGPVGAMYELGALRALEEAVAMLDLNDLHAYVGVSAGSLLAACLANGLTTRQMLWSVTHSDNDPLAFRADLFFSPAYGEIARRGLKLPALAVQALRAALRHPGRRALSEAIGVVAQALPVGVFDNQPVRRYLADLFSIDGRTDDFRQLSRRLTVVAADLETGTALRFGDRGLEDVPISLAVQASTAVPGLYPPVRIRKHDCVDGVLLKTVHASVALEHGAELLFCINPIVPVDMSNGVRAGRVSDDVLVQMGLPAILSQTFRTLIHSRLEVGMARYASRFPNADLVLLEPRSDEYGMFFANIFSFHARVAICERGYAATRADLLERYSELAPVLHSHGLGLRADVLLDPEANLWRGADISLSPDRPGRDTPASTTAVVSSLDQALAALEARLEPGAEEGAAPPATRRKRPAAPRPRRG